ncbi:hypothetical protein FRC09_005475 [Ceratobasidium sp. 395]|nr:hypothetical protein FRC09_005475 [Ceratobasidium sp. 395]
MVEHPDVCTASRKFYEFKNSLAEGFKRRSHPGIHGVEQKQRLLDNLNREIDRIVEMTLLRLALRQTQSNKHNPIDNFQVISAHEITDKAPVYDTMYWDPPVPASKSISWLLTSGRPVVTSSAWRAHLGKAPVIYKTFSSRSDSIVAAKVLSLKHPNIASVIGVTKGYDGLNGYALAAGKLFA